MRRSTAALSSRRNPKQAASGWPMRACALDACFVPVTSTLEAACSEEAAAGASLEESALREAAIGAP